MSSGKQAGLIVAAVLAGVVSLAGTPPVAHAQAVVTDPGCTANVLPRNDDDYTAAIPLGFDVFFGNQFHSTLHINNNGYVVFGTQTPVWWMLHAWELFSIPLIALYHTDVDTRAPGATPVSYGPITFAGRPALCINWVNVGYFDTQDDRLNSFQLILVSRSDTGAGDADIYMNYDRIAWDLGGVIAPRVGIFDGTLVLHEFPGSNAASTLLDGSSSALIGSSVGSAVLGRYVFQLRGGVPPETAVVTGTVLDSNGVPVPGALVQACDTCPFGVDACVFGSTDSAGHYSLGGFAQDDISGCAGWRVTVSPPASSVLLTNSLDVTFTATDQIISDANVILDFPEFVPSGTTITPSRGVAAGGVPTVFWQAPLTLTTTGCGSVLGLSDPIATYMITQDGNQDPNRCNTETPGSDPGLIRCGTMAETPLRSGIYVASVPPLAPAHGLVTVTMTLTCPDPDPTDGIPPPSGSSSFSLYIDPSGWVLTTRGAPLEGAQVTLYRAESPLGPFEIVPDGSALMSPKNRNNPDYADDAGHFGWDTVAGFYVVRAEYPGCFSPVNPSQAYVETDILAVPPEWVDLHLYLDCEGITPPELTLPAQVLAEASSTAGARVSYEVSAIDGRDGIVPVTCSPPPGGLFPVGVTRVACSASDSSGNVARGSFPVIVSYAWSNVLPPLHPGAGNLLKRGRAVPVKFALTGASAGIPNLAAHLYVAPLFGGIVGPEFPAESVGDANHGSQFRFQSRDHGYLFDWSTKGLAADDYQLRIDLGDGVSHTVAVELR
jgi:hypothetical protein